MLGEDETAEAPAELAEELVDLQALLALWRRAWPEAQHSPFQRSLLAVRAKQWADPGHAPRYRGCALTTESYLSIPKDTMRTTFLPFSPPLIGDDEIAEVLGTLRSAWLTTGSKVRRFAQEFAEFSGAPAGQGTSVIHRDILPGAWGMIADVSAGDDPSTHVDQISEVIYE